MEATAARASSDASAAVAHETSLFESFTAIPFVAGATLVPDPENDTLTLYVTTAQRDLAADGLRRSVAAVPLPKSLTSVTTKDSPTLRHPSFGMEERGVLLSSVSPSGRKRLVARDAKLAGGDRGSGIAFEVWEQGALVSETLVPPSTHGSLCVDGTFGGVSWSVKETRVAYVAEAPESEDRTPEWGMGVTSDAKTKAKKLPLPEDGEEDTKETEETVSEDQNDTSTKRRGWRGRGEWREDWGEQLVGKISPSLYVLELESCSVTVPKGLPGDAVVASGPAWAPASFGKESDQIVCAAWLGDITNFKSTSRRLGLVFCFNRPSALFLVSAPLPERAETEINADDTKSAVLLTKDVPSALWPRFSPDGKNLVYVSHERAVVTGAHAATCALRVMDWTKEGKPSRDVLGVETKKKTRRVSRFIRVRAARRRPLARERRARCADHVGRGRGHRACRRQQRRGHAADAPRGGGGGGLDRGFRITKGRRRKSDFDERKAKTLFGARRELGSGGCQARRRGGGAVRPGLAPRGARVFHRRVESRDKSFVRGVARRDALGGVSRGAAGGGGAGETRVLRAGREPLRFGRRIPADVDGRRRRRRVWRRDRRAVHRGPR
jgi:hypothetical protein